VFRLFLSRVVRYSGGFFQEIDFLALHYEKKSADILCQSQTSVTAYLISFIHLVPRDLDINRRIMSASFFESTVEGTAQSFKS
jgi:hypothetical protein